MHTKFITIINDCKSLNDIGRLSTRYSLLFKKTNINFIGVDSNLGINSTLEAAGNLIDILDAGGGQKGIVAVNVAPRGRVKEDGSNGSKFAFFWYKNTLVVSTIGGYTLSLIKKFGLTKHINVLITQEVLNFAVNKGWIRKNLANYIVNSQFRSLDFQPRVAKWLIEKRNIPYKGMSIDKVRDIPKSIWLVDSFGNAKTSLIKKDVSLALHKVSTNLGVFNYYQRLKLVPEGETAVYTGSSGIGKNRFLEIATQNKEGSAAKTLRLRVGDLINIL